MLGARIRMLRLVGCALLAVSLAGGCSVGGAAGGAVFGAVLKSLLDQVQSVVENAGQVADGVGISASGQVGLTIQAMEASFADDLDKTVDQLDTAESQALDQVKGEVQQLQSGVDETVKSAAKSAQQIALTLPLANKAPQVTSYTPMFVVAGSTANVPVKLDGVFAYGQDPRYPVSLTVDGQTFSPTENTTQELIFDIPGAVLAAGGKGIGTKKVTVSMGYADGLLLPQNRTATYQLLVGTLPAAPGQLTLVNTVHTTTHDRKHSATGQFIQESSNDDLDGNYCTDKAPDGWQIDPGSVVFNADWAQGDEGDQWSKQLERNDGIEACYLVHTVHHRIGTSGKVHFEIIYDLVRSRDVATPASKVLKITWGDQLTEPVTAAEWKLTFTGFDGRHIDMTGATNDRYLTVDTTGPAQHLNLVISAPDPAHIQF